MTNLEEMVELYASQVNAYFLDEDSDDSLLYEESDFHSLTCGWAMAHGLNPTEAYNFATHIRYSTNLG